MTTAALPELLTTREAAQRLRITERTVRRRIADGRLRAARYCETGPYRVYAKDVEALLEPAPPKVAA